MCISGTIGADEDAYGQEMALYLNEDDILKPKHKNKEKHGILKFCSRENPGMILSCCRLFSDFIRLYRL